MKKLIVAAMAVGTIAVAGAARADVIDSVGNAISNLFGVPYDPNPYGAVPGSVYIGSDGYRYQVDAAGRSIRLDQYATVVPYGGSAYPVGTPYDRDGDGIDNRYDRYPDDPRYR